MTSRILAVVGLLLPVAALGLEFARSAEDKSPPDKEEIKAQRAAALKAMKELAEKVQVTPADQPDAKPLSLIADALYRYDDPTREMNDGSVWAYGKTGRPAMLLTLAQYRHADGARSWIVEWNSLSDQRIVAKGLAAPYTPNKPGLQFKAVTGAPPPDKNAAIRSRQIKDLARRFTGFEYFSDVPYELRLLPQPIHRYSDPDHGIIEGGLFLYTHGGNPEVVLVLEARQAGDKETWSYALSRIAYAELRIKLDDDEVWKVTQLKGNEIGPTDPYWLSWQAISRGD